MNVGQKPGDWPTELKMFTIWSFKKQLADSWSRGPKVSHGIV